MLTGPLNGWAGIESREEIPQATERKNSTPKLTEVKNDPDLIRLSLAKQAIAGLQTQALVSSHYQTELQATASVIDIQPLLNLREQYFAVQTEVESANSALTLSRQAIIRTQELYRSGVNSQRQMQEQQLAHNAIEARLTASRYRLQSINDTLNTSWGSTLSVWVKTANHPEFNSFINGQQALLLISMPAGCSLKGITQIVVDPNSERHAPQTATFIANAPLGSELSQGETYFFKAQRVKLRTGMRLSAWISKPEQLLSGYFIPASALIWHSGTATIYLKTASEEFKRLSLKHYYPVTQGYFVADELPINAKVVSIGAQTLLSHEFRALIPAEDNDGDD
ncbi:MAG: hypothetical protein ABL903_07060 [Methylococcales bacterium]